MFAEPRIDEALSNIKANNLPNLSETIPRNRREHPLLIKRQKKGEM